MTQFKLGQRETTLYGAGCIDVLPYNRENDCYIVVLDKPAIMPLTKDKSVLSKTLVAESKYIK